MYYKLTIQQPHVVCMLNNTGTTSGIQAHHLKRLGMKLDFGFWDSEDEASYIPSLSSEHELKFAKLQWPIGIWDLNTLRLPLTRSLWAHKFLLLLILYLYIPGIKVENCFWYLSAIAFSATDFVFRAHISSFLLQLELVSSHKVNIRLLHSATISDCISIGFNSLLSRCSWIPSSYHFTVLTCSSSSAISGRSSMFGKKIKQGWGWNTIQTYN